MKWSIAFVLVLLVRVGSAQALPPVLQVGEISPAKHEVLAEPDQRAPMRDGMRLMVDIFRPRSEERFPAILWQTPYNKSGGAGRAQKFAARGYVVVNVDSRGRFDSEGDWDPFSALHKTDGYDLVEWIAKQPWCTGNVGTYGLSYMGWTQWWTASQSPPSLKAIVPEVAPPDHFYNCPYQNGIFVCWMMDWAGLMSARRPHSAGPGPYGGFAVNCEADHLKGIDNQVLADPPVQVFVMGRNAWRSAGDWPIPEAVPTKYYLHSQGHANSSAGDGLLDTQSPGAEPPDQYTYHPNDPTPSPAFANGHIDGPRDVSPAASRPDVLVYSTPVLDQDVEVIGPISAQLFAATSARDTDWMIRLVDVHPDGRALFLAEGVMRARHRADERNGAFDPERLSSLERDRVYPYAIDFWRPTGNLFAKGHRIRVEISSSYYPYYLRNLNTGEDNLALATQPVVARQTIRHDADHPSHIVLPVMLILPPTE